MAAGHSGSGRGQLARLSTRFHDRATVNGILIQLVLNAGKQPYAERLIVRERMSARPPPALC
jgi:hypothetical protein